MVNGNTLEKKERLEVQDGLGVKDTGSTINMHMLSIRKCGMFITKRHGIRSDQDSQLNQKIHQESIKWRYLNLHTGLK